MLLWLAVGPVLLFPHHFPRPLVLACLAFLFAPFVARRLRSGRFTRTTPANRPLIFLLLLLPVSLWLTPLRREVTWPHVTSLAWSIAAFFTVINGVPAQFEPDDGASVRYAPGLTWLTAVYLALGVAMTGAGVLGLNVPDKLFAVSLPVWVGGLPPIGDGYHPNEVGGMLTLFAPLAVALWLGSWHSARWASGQIALLLLLPVCLFFGAALLLSQSRSALFGVAAGVCLVMLAGGRAGRYLLGAGLVAVVAAVAVSGPTAVFERIVYAGTATPSGVLEPRLRIWQQVLYGIGDFPVTGLGLGASSHVLPVLYPQGALDQAGLLDDVHNLYLQTALDLGIPGLFAFGAILAMALARPVALLRDSHVRGIWRYWAAGLLASLVAHLLYSLADAVSLGTKPGFALWYLLGLIMATAVDRPARIRLAWSRRMALTIVAIILVGAGLWQALRPNYGAHLTARALVARTVPLAQAEARVAQLARATCRLYWHDGLLWHNMGDAVERDRAWSSLLDCSDHFVPLMQTLTPDNRPLADVAVQKQPGSAAAVFWLADISGGESPAAAVALYRRGLTLDPRDGRRWKTLGDLLVEAEPAAAIEAYLQSCYHGDPGANGCWRAGRTAEQQGDIRSAITYYRLSKWPVARARAAELEQELVSPPH
ncbi:MAG TPA: O-antigen ligase family protein [Anaerolineae bacterium]